MENRSGAFVRLAEARVNKALTAISHIRKLSNRNNYEYSDDQVKQILAALKSALQDTEDSFMLNKKSCSEFRFRKSKG